MDLPGIGGWEGDRPLPEPRVPVPPPGLGLTVVRAVGQVSAVHSSHQEAWRPLTPRLGALPSSAKNLPLSSFTKPYSGGQIL